ncbi:transposase [Streptomyces europaeiscabiei]|uniref:transposase n=1 Tax=Streptomyces europaeiscabiei TaxID=146819 RepID=UPI0029C9C365|nr:transposase [Streptomyces europaeiscabiei]
MHRRRPGRIAGTNKARHRLSRSGDRQLNSVLHTIAVTRIRMPKAPGHAYYQRKLSEGTTPREAKRCLKRRLADLVRRVMIADERMSWLASPASRYEANHRSPVQAAPCRPVPPPRARQACVSDQNVSMRRWTAARVTWSSAKPGADP